MYRRNAAAAFMRMWHNAISDRRSASSSGACWGSFGGRNTCSITESKSSESISLGERDMGIDGE
jgi:hypothetical protein